MNKHVLVAGLLAAVINGNLTQAQTTPMPTSPVLVWNQVALDSVARAKPTQHQAMRLMTYLSLAQHSAVTGAIPNGASTDTVATASMRVIMELLPSQAAFVEERHRQMVTNESDAGNRIATRVLEQARADGFTRAWTGQLPQGDNNWRSLANPPAPPAYPAVGGMRMFFADATIAARTTPPPPLGGTRFLEDLAEVRRVTAAPSEEYVRMAKFYDMTMGTLAAGFWNEQAVELVRKDKLEDARATTILTTMNAAMLDAVAICHGVKYMHWVPRPSQADPSIKPVIGVPNHPSYPSNHAAISTAAALVIAHFFPAERGRLQGIAAEAGMSRIYAGIHYRFDKEAGEEIGQKVAAAAIARYAGMLAQRTRIQAATN